MPRFVILRHELPQGSSHWDVMLEADAALLTWSIAELPAYGQTVVAKRLADHRQMYLDYEGPISGDRGHVCRWDSGTYETARASDGEHVVRMHGIRLNGVLDFKRIDETDHWELSLIHDP
jgi:hypothetical protein